jgi:hypothetical protein
MLRNVERRLSAISSEISGLRAEIGIVEEQLAFQRDVMEDTRVRALVAETPLAEREFRVAEQDFRRIERVAGEARARLAALLEERDRLLEELFAGSGAAPSPPA